MSSGKSTLKSQEGSSIGVATVQPPPPGVLVNMAASGWPGLVLRKAAPGALDWNVANAQYLS
jgi:hypothetical protein